MDRAEKAQLQLQAVAVLRMLKTNRTYEDLADLTDLPPGDLNRYVNGHVLPSSERAERIVGFLGEDRLSTELTDRIRTDAEGYVDNTAAVFDQQFLNLVAPVAIEANNFGQPEVILTAATDGITLAAAIAGCLGARCVYAKQRKETAVEEFIESRQRLESGIELTYYLPASAIQPGESTLVVDDIIRSGETQALLLDIADQAEADLAGVFTLIAVGTDGIARARQFTDTSVSALAQVDA